VRGNEEAERTKVVFPGGLFMVYGVLKGYGNSGETSLNRNSR
jgi:hypothetical protein